MAQVIAREVRRHRDARKISARQLAERCAEIGMDIPQPVLANLENGRRSFVSVAELLVLAAALDVPPILLVAPLGRQETTEILPGRELGTWDAVLWQSGEMRLTAGSTESPTELMNVADADAVVPLYHLHDQLVDECEAMADAWSADRSYPSLEDSAGNVIKDGRDFYWDAVDKLRQHRALMEQRGLLLPDLPPRLAEDVASETPRRRRR